MAHQASVTRSKKHRTMVKKLHTLLALPLDILDLPDFLQVDALLRSHEIHNEIKEAEIELPTMGDGSNETSIVSNNVVSAEATASFETAATFPQDLQKSFDTDSPQWLARDRALAESRQFCDGLFVAMVALLVAFGFRRSWTHSAEYRKSVKPSFETSKVESAPTSTDPKSMIQTSPSSTPESSPQSVKAVKTSLVIPNSLAAKILEQDRLENLVAQNVILQIALEEQRATVQSIYKELQARDEYMANLEHSYKTAVQDLAIKVQALSLEQQSTRELQEHQHQKEQQQQATLEDDRFKMIAAQAEALTSHVQERDQEWNTTLESTRQAMREKLIGQITAFKDQYIQNQQDGQAAAKKLEHSVSLQLGAFKQELEARYAQMAKLGAYLKTREGREQSQIDSLQDKLESLTGTAQALAEDLQRQGSQVVSWQRQVHEQVGESSTRFDELQKDMVDQKVLQESQSQTVRVQIADITSRLEGLQSSIEKTAVSVNESRSLRVCAEEIQALQDQFHSQQNQTASMSSALQEIAKELQNHCVRHNILKEDCLTHERKVASRLDAMNSEYQLVREDLHHEAGATDKKLSELSERVEFLQQKTTEWEHFKADCQDRLANSIDNVGNTNLELQAQKRQLEVDRVRYLDELASLSGQIRQITKDLHERINDEVRNTKADFICHFYEVEGCMKALGAAQQDMSKSLEEVNAANMSNAEELTKAIEQHSAAFQHLHTTSEKITEKLVDLQSRIARQEAGLSRSEENHEVMASTVKALSSENAKCGERIQDLEQENGNVKDLLAFEVDSIETRLAAVKEQLSDGFQATDEKCDTLTKQAEALTKQAVSQSDQILEVQQDFSSRSSKMIKKVQTLESRVETQDALQRESSEKIGNRCEALQQMIDKINGDLYLTRTEVEQPKCEQAAIEAEHNCQLNAIVVEPMMEDTPISERENESIVLADDEQVSAFSGEYDRDRTCMQENAVGGESLEGPSASPAKESYKHHPPRSDNEAVCLATKLITFEIELQRRNEIVVELETHVKERSETFLSRTDVLKTEIDQQREQLKRWDLITYKNEDLLKQKTDECQQLAAKESQYRRKCGSFEQTIADLEATLKEDGTSLASVACLSNKLKLQKEHYEKFRKKVLDVEVQYKECNLECSKLSAKQELFMDELSRRQRRLGKLRSNLGEILDLVAVEREDLEAKLLQRRQERDEWREKTDMLRTLLLNTEKYWAHLEEMKNIPSSLFECIQDHKDCPLSDDSSFDIQTTREEKEAEGREGEGLSDPSDATTQNKVILSQSSCVRESLQARKQQCVVDFNTTLNALKETLVCAEGERNAGPSGGDFSSRDDAIPAKVEALKSQLEEWEKQQKTFESTKKELESQLLESKENYKALAEKMEKISDNFSAKESLAAKVESLQAELKNREDQLFRFEQEQSQLKSDLFEQMEYLQSNIRSLEEFQHNCNVPSAQTVDASQRFDDLSARIEILAGRFAGHGDIVARVGAVSEAIQRCENQLASFEEGLGNSSDMSDMVDFFKSDIQALKQLLNEKLDFKGKEFLRLLSKMEDLADRSEDHGAQLQHVEASLRDHEEICTYLHNEMQELSEKAQTQAKHILQHINEKYIDVATKVDLLASEMQTTSSQTSVLEKKVKDRESLFLSQMNAVRGELEASQARNQEEVQVRMYNVMLQLLRFLAKKQQFPSQFLTWNAKEEILALEQYGSAAGEDKAAREHGEEGGTDHLVSTQKSGGSLVAGRRFYPSTGYSMASGIMVNNLFVPAMLVPLTATKGSRKRKDD